MPKSFNEKYDLEAVQADEIRIREAADKFWAAVPKPITGWIQPYESNEVYRALGVTRELNGTARDIAMLLDLAPEDVDFRTKASVAYWLTEEFYDVCNS